MTTTLTGPHGKRAGTPSSFPHRMEMTAADEEALAARSEHIGSQLLPILESLAEVLPSVTSIMVSTADGFNLCAMGLSADTVDQVSAMGSALHSVARAATSLLGASASTAASAPGEPTADVPLEMLTISHADHNTVVLSVPHAGDHALLWVTGTEDSLGAVLFRARAVIPQLSAVLAAADQDH